MLLLSLFVFWHSSKFGIVEIDAIYIKLRVIYEFGTSLGILWVAILKYSEFKARRRISTSSAIRWTSARESTKLPRLTTKNDLNERGQRTIGPSQRTQSTNAVNEQLVAHHRTNATKKTASERHQPSPTLEQKASSESKEIFGRFCDSSTSEGKSCETEIPKKKESERRRKGRKDA